MRLHAEREPIYRELADAIMLSADARARRARVPARAGRSAGRPADLGAERLRLVPGVGRRPASWPWSRLGGPGPRVLRHRYARRRRSTPTRSGPARADHGSRRRVGRRRMAEAERVLRGAGRAPVRPARITSSHSAAGSSATSPASAPPPTSAASRSCRCRRACSRRSIPRTAARPGWTWARPRTTWAPTTSPPAVIVDVATLATLPAEELASGFVEVVKTALLAGGSFWERVRAIDALDPVGVGAAGRRLRGHEARGRCRATSATVRDGRSSTSATRSGTRSRRRAATRSTATARRWASDCLRRCG